MNKKKWIPLLLLLAAMLTLYFLDLTNYLTFENIKKNQQLIRSSIDHHPLLLPSLFMLLYILVVALSLPGASSLTLLGGFFFGLISTVYVVLAATIGASIIFLIAHTALGGLLKKKGEGFFSKVARGFHKNSVSYLLLLRLIPLFPFFLVNLAPAFFNIPLRTYVWTTFVGIIPGSYAYTQAGRGLGAIFEKGDAFSIETIFNGQMKIALVVLVLFVSAPIFFKPLIKRFGKEND